MKKGKYSWWWDPFPQCWDVLRQCCQLFKSIITFAVFFFDMFPTAKQAEPAAKSPAIQPWTVQTWKISQEDIKKLGEKLPVELIWPLFFGVHSLQNRVLYYEKKGQIWCRFAVACGIHNAEFCRTEGPSYKRCTCKGCIFLNAISMMSKFALLWCFELLKVLSLSYLYLAQQTNLIHLTKFTDVMPCSGSKHPSNKKQPLYRREHYPGGMDRLYEVRLFCVIAYFPT